MDLKEIMSEMSIEDLVKLLTGESLGNVKAVKVSIAVPSNLKRGKIKMKEMDPCCRENGGDNFSSQDDQQHINGGYTS